MRRVLRNFHISQHIGCLNRHYKTLSHVGQSFVGSLATVCGKQGREKHGVPVPFRAREGRDLSKTNPAGNPGPPPEARPDGGRGAEQSGDGVFAGRDVIKRLVTHQSGVAPSLPPQSKMQRAGKRETVGKVARGLRVHGQSSGFNPPRGTSSRRTAGCAPARTRQCRPCAARWRVVARLF